MKIFKGFKFLMVILGVVACSRAALAEIVLLSDHELDAVRGQAGIVSIGLDSLGSMAMRTVERLEGNQEVSVQEDVRRIELGVVREDALLTLEGVELTGHIHTGSSFSEVVEKDGHFAIHCHFDNYRVTIDRFKVDAIYAGDLTSGASFGALEMTGFSMEISGDVTIMMHD